MTTTKKLMKVCKWDVKKIHPYEICTSRAKHPVHMIEGGMYITEDMTETDPQTEMGVWGLNAQDYEWFKSHLIEMEIEVIDGGEQII